MPRFTPDPTKVTTGFPVYPKGSYVVEIGEPKTFFNPGKDGKGDNFGVRFAGKIVEPTEFAGKPYSIQCMQHTEGSQSFSKNYQMAALGYNPSDNDSQAAFNTEKGMADWSFNTDDNTVGDGWHEMKGKVIRLDLDTAMDKDQKEQQKVSKIYPY
jgi:hypothetical protein